MNAIGNGLLRLVGVRRQQVEAERYHTTEELQYIIEESQEGGLLRGESGEILRELFEFGDLTAGEVMVPRVMLTGIAVGSEIATSCEAIVQKPTRTPAIPSTAATSTTSSAACTSNRCCATSWQAAIP